MRSRIYWILLITFVLLSGSWFILSVLNGFPNGLLLELMVPIAFISMASVGFLIIFKQPRNLIGWLLVTASFGILLIQFSSEYAYLALHATNQRLPFGLIFAWNTQWIWITYAWPIGVGLPLLFPNGQLLSPRWRLFVWLFAAFFIANFFVDAFSPGPLPGFTPYINPVGISALDQWVAPLHQLLGYLSIPFVLLASISLFLRYRKSRGEERAQIKWFLYAVTLLLLWVLYSIPAGYGILPGFAAWVGTIIFTLLTAFLAIAIGIAVLKYHLYDIDLIIRRTLVYGIMTATLAAVYWGSVVLLQSLFTAISGRQSAIAIVVSTLMIAALFTPLRRFTQNSIDRRFYRKKYDAEKILTGFSDQLRNEVDLNTLSDRLVGVIEETIQPDHVSLWLKNTDKKPLPDWGTEVLKPGPQKP